MAGDADRIAVGIADQPPGGVVEIAIEVGQHHRALRRARDRGDQPRRRAVGAGRAGDDRRPARAVGGERLDFGVDRQRGAARAIDQAALGEPVGPVGEGDLEEVEGDAPIGIEAVGDQIVQPPGSTPSMMKSSIRPARSPASANAWAGLVATSGGSPSSKVEPSIGADAADRASERLTPGVRQPRQDHPARQVADRRRRLVRRRMGRRRADRARRRSARRRRAGRCAAG